MQAGHGKRARAAAARGPRLALAALLIAWAGVAAQERPPGPERSTAFGAGPFGPEGRILPTHFGVTDREVPFDARHWARGQAHDFPDWDVSPEAPDDVFTFVRLRYNSGTWMGRIAKWTIDYPEAELNFSYRLQQLTSIEVNPHPVVIDIDADQLRQYPFVYMVEPGDIWISDEEAEILRDYMLNGGFIMVDDFWGIAEWNAFHRALKQIFPDRDYVELELDHPIFNIVFEIDAKPQIPAVGLALRGREAGITYDHSKPGSETPHYRAVMDDDGRICMIICFNTDLGDGWEEEGTDPWFFREFSEQYGYPLGINIVFYALTH